MKLLFILVCSFGIPSFAFGADFFCKQQFANGRKKNCATTVSAPNSGAALASCKAAESAGGHGCCKGAKVWTKAWGNVTKVEVIPAGSTSGTLHNCP